MSYLDDKKLISDLTTSWMGMFGPGLGLFDETVSEVTITGIVLVVPSAAGGVSGTADPLDWVRVGKAGPWR